MAGKSILIVDGSGVSREIVARILNDVLEDANLTTCGSGEKALEELDEGRYDLVTTGLMLPDMDGLELCSKIRKTKTHQHTPIIVISGDADSRLLKEGFKAGVTDYFDKSLGYKAFGDFVKAFMERSSGLVGRILYVEDSMTAATMTKRMLAKQGLQVTHVTNAEDGMHLMQKDKDTGTESFDLLITDFFLEGEMTGGDLLHCVRTRYRLSPQELPVLILTGNDDQKSKSNILHAGANDFVTKPLIEEVLLARIRNLLLIKQQHDALTRQTLTMERVATTDALTGVRNRRYLVDEGQAFLNRDANQPLWAMIVDIDHLTELNANKGHIIGDHILAAVGKLLTNIHPEAMVVRFGGEEFAVLLPRHEREPALVAAEQLRISVTQMSIDGVKISVSIGIAGAKEHPTADLNGLLGVADQALTMAKNSGRNCVYYTDAVGKISRITRNGD